MKRAFLVLLLLLANPVWATVTVTTVKTGELDCDGDTLEFAFSFPYNATSEVMVDVITDAGDVASRQTETSDYSVSPSSSTSGGTVTFVSAPDDGNYVIISRTTSITQDADLDAGAYTSRAAIEAALDEIYHILQEHDDAITRSIRAPQGEVTTDFVLPGALARAGQYPYFSSSGAFTVTDTFASDTASITSFMETVLDDTTDIIALGTLFNSLSNANLRTWKGYVNLDHVYDVRDYGATGDGETDDTTAIQAAIDAAAGADEIGDTTVFFPSGTYIVTNLIVYARTRLVGDYMLTTFLKAKADTTGNIIEDNGSATKVCLVDLTINGNDESCDGINLGNNTTQLGTYSWIDRVWVTKCDTCFDLNINAGFVGDIYATNYQTDGVILRGAANWYQTISVVGAAADTPDKGVHVLTSGSKIESLHAEGTFTNPLYIANSSNVISRYYLAPEASATITDAVYITSTKLGNSIEWFYVNLSPASSALTNFVNDQYSGVTQAWVGGDGGKASYTQGGKWDYNVIAISDDLTIPSLSEVHCVVADGLSANIAVYLPRLSGSLNQEITVVNADDTYKVYVRRSASDAAGTLIGGVSGGIWLEPLRSCKLICDQTSWFFTGGDVSLNKSETLLATGTVNLQNGDSKTSVYTVPANRKAVITKVVIRAPSASLAGGTDFDIGSGANADTWKQTNNLSSMTATTDYMVITSENTKYTLEAAAAEFGIKPITGATADATATMDVFGYIY